MSTVNEIANIANGEGGYSGVVTSINNVAKSGMSVAKKISNFIPKADESSSKHIRDVITNGFNTTGDDSVFVPEFFARAFDEPTYLTFRVEFIFNDPYRNAAYTNNGTNDTNTSAVNAMMGTWNFSKMYDLLPEPFLQNKSWIGSDEDGVIESVTDADSNEGFAAKKKNVLDADRKYFEDFYGEMGILDTEPIQNLLSNTDKRINNLTNRQLATAQTYSTEDYLLRSLGEPARYLMLRNFKKALKDIQNVYPFYITGISGLESLAKITPNAGIRLKDAVVTLNCMEALDMRITQLLQLYRKIVWDDVYQRWILPDMMRYFGMRIYVSEIRVFHEMRGATGKAKNPRLMNMHEDLNKMRFTSSNKLGSVLNTINSAITTATAVSSSLLGPTNVISKYANKVGGTINTVNEIADDVLGFYVRLCDSALNAVMPTICFECHMCEFDISDTLAHIGSLSSAMKETKSPAPAIKIKVGQVTDTQMYPLNIGLGTTGDRTYSLFHSMSEDTDIFASGSIISDEAMNRPISKKNINGTGDIVNRYKDNIRETLTADGEDFYLLKQRHPEQFINRMLSASDNGKMNYDIDNPSAGSAQGIIETAMSLGTTLTNELTSSINITKDSLATNQDETYLAQVKDLNAYDYRAAGDVLKTVAEKIWDSDEIKSSATSEEMRNMIAENAFNGVLDELYKSKATEDTALRNIIEVYKNQ